MFSATAVGRIGTPPETRSTGSGKSITSFTVATDFGFGDKKKTTWIKAILWGEQGERAAQWLSKGGRVAITGDVYNDEWTGKEGDKRTTLCMDVRSFENLEPKRDDGPPRRESRPAREPEMDPEIPF